MKINKIKELNNVMNAGNDQSKRFSREFGIYSTTNNKKKKIFDPVKDKDKINILLNKVIEKSNIDSNIIEMIHTHILFEKIHPFVDANGRIGRLILQRSMARLMNFSDVLPLSWALFSNITYYCESFDILSEKDIDKGVKIY